MAADSTAEAERSLPLQQMESSKHESDETPAIEGDGRGTTATKPLAFYLGFLGLNINALVFSLDATSLVVAVPVSFISP
jgi:hypothetical protein